MEEKTVWKSSAKKLPIYGKNNIMQCQLKFREHILEKINNIPEIKNNMVELSLKGKIGDEKIRPSSWKIFLNTLSCNDKSTLKSWLEETLSKRKSYKKMVRENINISKFIGDPLGGGNNDSPWGYFFDEGDIKHLIQIDVDRTYQEKELFCEPAIKELEFNILYLFSKDNQPISYKQGMGDILALLIYSFYPFYTKSSYKKYTNELFDQWCSNPLSFSNEIYCFFHDEEYLQGDLYYLMTNIMRLGINKFYEDIDIKKNPEEKKNYLIKRCERIVEKKLKIQNSRLYHHFINIGIDCGIVLQRWIKCLFIREFHPQDCAIIWDSIIANEVQDSSGELLYADFFSIAMLSFISDELLRKDQSECFKRLFQYPPLESMTTLLKLTEKIRPELIKSEKLEEEKESLRLEKIQLQKKQMDEMAYKNQKLREIKEQNIDQKKNQYLNRNNNSLSSFIMGQSFDDNLGIPQNIMPFFPINNNEIISPKLDYPNNNQVLTKINFNFSDKKGKINNREVYENKKLLEEIKTLINKYKLEFDKLDKMKIDYLISKLENNI